MNWQKWRMAEAARKRLGRENRPRLEMEAEAEPESESEVEYENVEEESPNTELNKSIAEVEAMAEAAAEEAAESEAESEVENESFANESPYFEEEPMVAMESMEMPMLPHGMGAHGQFEEYQAYPMSPCGCGHPGCGCGQPSSAHVAMRLRAWANVSSSARSTNELLQCVQPTNPGNAISPYDAASVHKLAWELLGSYETRWEVRANK